METIRALLGFLFRLAVALFLFAIVWWVVGVFFPTLTVRTLLSPTSTSTADGDWLPAPGSVGGLFGKPKTPSDTDNLFVYKGPIANAEYVTYTYPDGSQTSNGTNNNGTGAGGAQGYDPRISYIRNLSIYQGGHLYTGLAFEGDARNTMFQNGRFPIAIVDPSNRLVTTILAEATTNWSVPGWVRFKAKITTVLPNQIPCTMIFQEATEQNMPKQVNTGQYSYSSYSYSNDTVKKVPARVAVPFVCN